MAKKIQQTRKMKKLRFIKTARTFKKKEYISKMSGSEAVQAIKTRLNMLPVYGNYKHDLTLRRLCVLCDKEDDTTEHLLECEVMGVNNISAEHLKNDDNVQLWQQINEVTKFNLGSSQLLKRTTIGVIRSHIVYIVYMCTQLYILFIYYIV